MPAAAKPVRNARENRERILAAIRAAAIAEFSENGLKGTSTQAIAARAEDGAPCAAYLGPDGAGHFVKMVHNGIEYGMMQSIAEGFEVISERKDYYGAGIDALVMSKELK